MFEGIPLPTGVSYEELESTRPEWWTCLCSFCGTTTDEIPEHCSICKKLYNRIQKILEKSTIIKTWDDMWYKVDSVYALKEKVIRKEIENLDIEEGSLEDGFIIAKEPLFGEAHVLLVVVEKEYPDKLKGMFPPDYKIL